MEIHINTVKLEPDETDILVTDGLHCGVEPIGGAIVDYLDEHPLDGVVTHRIYPEAVAAGKRYLSSRELGSRFDLETLRAKSFHEMDNDEKAALRFIAEHPNRYWLGIDPHTSNARNSNCLVVSNKLLQPHIIGVAGVLGLRNVIVIQNYPFFNMFPKFASVETELAENNPLSDPKVWREHLATMHRMGVEEMVTLSEEIMPDLKYYDQVDLMRIDEKGRVNEPACAVIKQLEAIDQEDAYFTPLKRLPDYFAGRVPEGRTVRSGFWNDNNNSPEMPELLGYREDGRARRACFGSFLLEISPPEVIVTS